MKISLNALACLFLLSLASSAFAGPFGLDMGMSKSQLGDSWRALESSPGYYVSKTPPKPHSAFDNYIVKLSATHGLCWIKAVGKDVSTNGYGTSLKSAFGDLRERLSAAYGNAKIDDFLVSGSIWDDPDDWMMGLARKDRYYMAQWNEESGAEGCFCFSTVSSIIVTGFVPSFDEIGCAIVAS